MVDIKSKYLFTETVKSKHADTIKNALALIFKKVEKIQKQFKTTDVHLKRLCTGKQNVKNN